MDMTDNRAQLQDTIQQTIAAFTEQAPARSSSGDTTHDLAGLVTELRRSADHCIDVIRKENPDREFELVDYAHGLLNGDMDVVEDAGPIICRLLGLPADPWPGLTGEDLERMTKGRIREARRRGIYWFCNHLDFAQKLDAARHRAWLERR